MSGNHIVALQASNFKRLKAIKIDPSESGAVIVAGRNGAGKSSILDAILAALAGASKIDDVPVRVGEESAEIALTIDTDPPIKVERKITADGKTSLKLYTELPAEDGGKPIKSSIPKPQTVLDSLVGKVAFDPLEFTRLSPQKQLTLLAELVGIDPKQLDGQIAAAMEDRAEQKKDLARAKANVEGMPKHDDAPAEEVSTEDLLAELSKAQQANEAKHRQEQLEQDLIDGIELAENEIKKLEQELGQWREKLADRQQLLREARSRLDEMQEIDTAPIKHRISMASELNRKVAENRQRAKAAQQVELLEAKVSTLDETVESLRAKRLETMQGAKWPIEGLGFGPHGVTFNDLPFSQCSSAEQLRISTAIGLSQNPTLRLMFIRDGSLLDDESLAAIHAMAIEANAQIWVERVGTGDAGAIVIEDGEVVS